MPFCQICHKFFHSSTNCHQKKENGTTKSEVNKLQPQDSTNGQGTISALSDPISQPTPRVSALITQDGVNKGKASVLPDSGSVTEIMPTKMAKDLGLVLQRVDSSKYKLQTPNNPQSKFILSLHLNLAFLLRRESHHLPCI